MDILKTYILSISDIIVQPENPGSSWTPNTQKDIGSDFDFWNGCIPRSLRRLYYPFKIKSYIFLTKRFL